MRHNLKLITSCYRCGICKDRNSTFKEGNWLCGSSDPVMPIWTSLVAQVVKNLPAMQETQVRSLGWEDPLEKGIAIHSSILAWRIPWTEEPGKVQSMESQRFRHDCATNIFSPSWITALLW